MTVSQDTLKEQLRELPEFARWASRKECSYLHEMLSPGELLRGMSLVLFERAKWLLVITDHRMLLLQHRLLLGIREQDILFDAVKSVSHRSGVLLGKIVLLMDDGSYTTFSQIEKSDVSRLAAVLSELVEVSLLRKDDRAKAAQLRPKRDFITQVERLSKLKDKGLISEEEFEEDKHLLRVREHQRGAGEELPPLESLKANSHQDSSLKKTLTLYVLATILLLAGVYGMREEQLIIGCLLIFLGILVTPLFYALLRALVPPFLARSVQICAAAAAIAVAFYVVPYIAEQGSVVQNSASIEPPITRARLKAPLKPKVVSAKKKPNASGNLEDTGFPQLTVRNKDTLNLGYPVGTTLALRVWRWHSGHGLVTVEGKVTNVSGRLLEDISAIADFYDPYEAKVSSAAAPLDRNPFPAGETSIFRISTEAKPSIDTVAVRFVDRSGREVVLAKETSSGDSE